MTTETWILLGITSTVLTVAWIFIFAPDFIKNWKDLKNNGSHN